MGIVPRKNPFNFGSDMDKWSVPGLLILLKLSDLGVGIMPHWVYHSSSIFDFQFEAMIFLLGTQRKQLIHIARLTTYWT